MAIHTHVQDSLAAERRRERDRIAQELIETMSQKLGSGSSQNRHSVYTSINSGHGVH